MEIDIGLGFNFHDYPCSLNLITGLNFNSYGYSIKDVNLLDSKFIIAGDKTAVFDFDHNTIGFQPNAVFDIYGSTGNDGRWTVTNVIHVVESDAYGNVTKDVTEITVSEAITSSVINGTIQLPILLPITKVVTVIDNYYVTNAFEIQ